MFWVRDNNRSECEFNMHSVITLALINESMKSDLFCDEFFNRFLLMIRKTYRKSNLDAQLDT